MRKINKKEQLSTAYKEWEKNLEDNKKTHPSYDNAKIKGEFYTDIVMDALRCQKGYVLTRRCNFALLSI